MQVSELEHIIIQLIQEVAAIRADLDGIRKSLSPRMPEWVSLREACQFAGVSYNSLRRTEYRDRRPGMEAIINGVREYPRKAVVEWATNLGRREGRHEL